jgi:hypothetical protein
MSKYDIHFGKLTKPLLPFSLREALKDMVAVLVMPFEVLFEHLRDYCSARFNDLRYNSQYPSMQRMLNDRIDATARRIRVSDNLDAIQPVLAYPSGTVGKQQLVATFTVSSWLVWGYRGFAVALPSALNQNQKNRVKKLVNTYKFTGTSYSIIIDN